MRANLQVLHQYGLAIAAVALASVLTVSLGQFVDAPPYALFYAVVAFTAFSFGLGPSLVATMCAAISVDLFLSPPILSFWLSSDDLLRLIAFVLVAVLISAMTEQRRRAQASLVDSEQRFRTLFESSPIGIAIARRTIIRFANPAFLRLYGYEDAPQEVIGQSLLNLVPPELREEVADRNRRREQGEAMPGEYESIGLRRDGSRFPYAIHVTRIELPDGPASIGFVTDITARRKTAQDLIEGQERLRAVLDTAVDGIITINARGTIESANPATERIFGYTQAELIGQNVSILMPTPDREQHDQYLENYLRTGIKKIIGIGREVLGRKKDGSTFQLDLAVSELHIEGRQLFTGIVRDISQRKAAEEALRLSERRLLRIIQQSPISIQIFSPQGYAIDANQSWEKLWGATRQQMLEHRYNILHDPVLEKMGLRPLIERAFAGEEVYIPPLLYDPAENNLPGRPRWAEAYLYSIKDDDGRIREVVIMHTDVTDLKEAERERTGLLQREQAARADAETAHRQAAFLAEASKTLVSSLEYQATLESIARLALPDFADACSIDLLNEDGTLRQVVVRHVVPEKEKVARELRQKYPPDLSKPHPIARAIETARAEMVPEIPEELLRAVARDEEHLRLIREFNILSYIIAPLNARGRTLGTMTFVTTGESGRRYGRQDLSTAEELARRAALAVDNARLYREAQEANRMKDEFLATLSHELRTPLNAILGWSQLLRTGKLESAEIEEAIEVIERNAQAQAQLVDDLLDVSRIITGRLPLEVRPTDLAPIIDAALRSLEPAIKAKAIQLDRRLDGDAGPVSADLQRIQQVLWNLLSNAIKFTPRGGRITVSAGTVDSHVEVSVSDNGAGIEPEFLPHVFERFRQADASTTRAHGGLGLGLAIVRHLVELHGGTVHADSPGRGRGATFTIRLPLLAVRPMDEQPHEVAAVAEGGDAGAGPSLQGRRVLVVDDDAEARRLLETVLRSCGAQVQTASSATQALDQIEHSRPDVLISDIGMPEIDGYELIRRLRQKERDGRHLPAIALTAYARSEDRLRALAAGYQSFVAKPVNPVELAMVVSNLAEAG